MCGYLSRLVAVALLLAACAGSSVSVTRMEQGAQLPAVAPEYHGASAAIEQGDFEYVARSTYLAPEERDLAAALGNVQMGSFAEAERALGRLAGASSESVRHRARIAHVDVLSHQARWGEILQLYPNADEVLPQVQVWANAAPERVTFTAPSVTLPASREDLHMPFVEVHVGDRAYTFLLDTGATYTVISADVAEAAGVAPSDAGTEVATATTRRVGVRPAVLPWLSVGNAVFENHPCFVADRADLSFSFLLIPFLRLDGALGWNAIRRLDLEVDFRVPEVTIREPRPRAVKRNLFWLGAPLVRAHLADGVPILVGLDTGAPTSTLLPSFFGILPEAYWTGITGKPREGSSRVWGVGGSERVPTRTVEKLSVVFDRHVLAFRNLESREMSRMAIFVPVMMFGNDIALESTLRIDFANGALELGQ